MALVAVQIIKKGIDAQIELVSFLFLYERCSLYKQVVPFMNS